MSNLNTVNLHSVEIERGKDKIVRDVPEHELLVLRRIHRPDHIRVVAKDVDTLDLDVNAHAEFLRLQNKYRRVGAPDPALLAFPGGAPDLDRYGFSLDGQSEETPQSQQIDHAKLARQAKMAEKAGKKAA